MLSHLRRLKFSELRYKQAVGSMTSEEVNTLDDMLASVQVSEKADSCSSSQKSPKKSVAQASPKKSVAQASPRKSVAQTSPRKSSRSASPKVTKETGKNKSWSPSSSSNEAAPCTPPTKKEKMQKHARALDRYPSDATDVYLGMSPSTKEILKLQALTVGHVPAMKKETKATAKVQKANQKETAKKAKVKGVKEEKAKKAKVKGVKKEAAKKAMKKKDEVKDLYSITMESFIAKHSRKEWLISEVRMNLINSMTPAEKARRRFK